MLLTRTAVRALALTGDPVCRILGRQALVDPYPDYSRIQARGDLVRHPLGLYLTASHAVAKAVLRDGRFVVEGSVDRVGVDWNLKPGDPERLIHPTEESLLVLNPPRHTALRRLVGPAFAPGALNEHVGRIEHLVDGYLDQAARRGQFDLVDDFAMRLPTRVICDLMGIPEPAYASFARWSPVLAGTIDGIRTPAERRAVRTTLLEMTQFFDTLIVAKRERPGDDLVSQLVRAEIAGAPVGRRDLVALCGLLLIAGFETTVNLISCGALAMLRDREQRQLVLDSPGVAANLVEEALRYDTPVQFALRKASANTRVAGVDLPAGALVLVLLAGANRDPATFADPSRFDVLRPNSREHLAFSGGVHYCLGASLARLEAEIALRRLFARFPRLTVRGPARYKRIRNVRGLSSLPVQVS